MMASAAPPRRTTIFCRGYQALLVTQFFGACNDNLLKQLGVPNR